MLLVKLPVPLPSVVWLSAMVGLDEVLQHTPRVVTIVPFEAVTVPPQVAVLYEMSETEDVVTVIGKRQKVKVMESFPATETSLKEKLPVPTIVPFVRNGFGLVVSFILVRPKSYPNAALLISPFSVAVPFGRYMYTSSKMVLPS